MKDFPKLSLPAVRHGGISFVKTREQFHLIANLIGKVRETLVKPIAKNDNLWLSVVDNGFAVPPIENLNVLEIGCNPEKLILEVANNKNQYDSIAINGKTIAGLRDGLNSVLKKYGVNVEIDISKFDNPSVFEIAQIDSLDFLTQLYNFHWLLKEFHSRIREGVKTQVCLWPHHFDNAFIWFSGRKINEADEQIGIGVSNGDDSYSLPYIYMTFWPELRKTNTLEIPEGAILHDSDWMGMILPYDSIEEKKNIEGQKKLIEDFFNISFESIKRGFTKR